MIYIIPTPHIKTVEVDLGCILAIQCGASLQSVDGGRHDDRFQSPQAVSESLREDFILFEIKSLSLIHEEKGSRCIDVMIQGYIAPRTSHEIALSGKTH